MALKIFVREESEYDESWSKTDLSARTLRGFNTVQVEDFCQDTEYR